MTFQKSFSDQAGRNKRSPWQRSRSNPVPGPGPGPRTPLQPVSEVTKNKLNRFQYHPKPGGESVPEDVENEQNTTKTRATDMTTTPATRLTWRDLMEKGKALMRLLRQTSDYFGTTDRTIFM
ncbi:hypothetical protein FCULG_00010241 [Fusarium culmorum]|uniref:Uncharacterized protein n=1 Tax=Fusarium culmorum TaxID=5516 RepID=A0A2T4GDK8_FUSCU|nr:hypothetical protein FCULG_00010241 [Fusarium culmorum]